MLHIIRSLANADESVRQVLDDNRIHPTQAYPAQARSALGFCNLTIQPLNSAT